MTVDLPEVLNIFLINFLDSFSSFSIIEIAFALHHALPFSNQMISPTIVIPLFFNKYQFVLI